MLYHKWEAAIIVRIARIAKRSAGTRGRTRDANGNQQQEQHDRREHSREVHAAEAFDVQVRPCSFTFEGQRQAARDLDEQAVAA